MKYRKLILMAIMVFAFNISTYADVYLRYYNKDSKTWTFKVKIGGSNKEVTFDSSRTSSVTINGAYETAEIETECGWVTVSDDDRIEIKDGCIKVN